MSALISRVFIVKKWIAGGLTLIYPGVNAPFVFGHIPSFLLSYQLGLEISRLVHLLNLGHYDKDA
jgi:hypothetical protein